MSVETSCAYYLRNHMILLSKPIVENIEHSCEKLSLSLLKSQFHAVENASVLPFYAAFCRSNIVMSFPDWAGWSKCYNIVPWSRKCVDLNLLCSVLLFKYWDELPRQSWLIRELPHNQEWKFAKGKWNVLLRNDIGPQSKIIVKSYEHHHD